MGLSNLFAVGRSMVGLGRKPAYRTAEPGLVPMFKQPVIGNTADTGLFSSANAKAATDPVKPANQALSTKPASTLTFADSIFKPKHSFFGWLWGGNRRRVDGRLVQGEFRLQNVRPLQNSLRDDDSLTVVERRDPKVLFQTPPAAPTNDNQDHAWRRLRDRNKAGQVVKLD